MERLFVVSRPITEALADDLLTWAKRLQFHELPYRGRVLKRTPKREWRKSRAVGIYRFGQEKRAYELVETGFPPIIRTLVRKLGLAGIINSCIVSAHTDGAVHHIPWHHDKQVGAPTTGAKDIEEGTTIYNLVVCDRPRCFQVAFPGHTEDPQEYIFNRPLEHGELISITALGNKLTQHRVPIEKGYRYSICFRTISPAQPDGPTSRTRSSQGSAEDSLEASG